MKKATIFLILFSIFGFITAQSTDNQLQTIKTVKGNALSADPNGNLYVVDGPLLYKFDSEGRFLHKYSNFLWGDITSIDVDNPLKIMVFYKNESQILFLDKNLIPLMEPLDLYANNFKNIQLATYSTDNTIWLYDAVLQDLINVNFQLKELSRNHLSMRNFNPTQFFSIKEKQLIMFNPATGVVFFDAFGTYLKTIALPTECPRISMDANSTYLYFIKSATNSTTDTNDTSRTQFMYYDYLIMDAHQICELENAGSTSAPLFSKNNVWYIDTGARIQKIEFIE